VTAGGGSRYTRHVGDDRASGAVHNGEGAKAFPIRVSAAGQGPSSDGDPEFLFDTAHAMQKIRRERAEG